MATVQDASVINKKYPHPDKADCPVCLEIYNRIHKSKKTPSSPFYISVDGPFGIPPEDWEFIEQELTTQKLGEKPSQDIEYVLKHPYIDPDDGLMKYSEHEVKWSIFKEQRGNKDPKTGGLVPGTEYDFFNVGRDSSTTKRTLSNTQRYMAKSKEEITKGGPVQYKKWDDLKKELETKRDMINKYLKEFKKKRGMKATSLANEKIAIPLPSKDRDEAPKEKSYREWEKELEKTENELDVKVHKFSYRGVNAAIVSRKKVSTFETGDENEPTMNGKLWNVYVESSTEIGDISIKSNLYGVLMKRILKENKKSFFETILRRKHPRVRNYVKIHNTREGFNYMEGMRDKQWEYHKNLKDGIYRYETIKEALKKTGKGIEGLQDIEIKFKNPGIETKPKQSWDAELQKLDKGIYDKDGIIYQVPEIGKEIKRRHREKVKKGFLYGGLIVGNIILGVVGVINTFAAVTAYVAYNAASALFGSSGATYNGLIVEHGSWEDLWAEEQRYQEWMDDYGHCDDPNLVHAHNDYNAALAARGTMESSQDSTMQNQSAFDKSITKLSVVGAVFAVEGISYLIYRHLMKKHTGHPGGIISEGGYSQLLEMDEELKKRDPDYSLIKFKWERLSPIETEVQTVSYKK